MNVDYKHVKIFAVIGLTAGSWIGYGITKTKKTLNNAVDNSILQIFEPQAFNRSKDKQYDTWLEPSYSGDTKNFINRSVTFLKFILARRLLNIALGDNNKLRLHAVDQLGKLKLNKLQYSIIGQMCDARTTVGLARTIDVNEDFFLPPPRKYGTYSNQLFLHAIKDYLSAIYHINAVGHHCIEKSILKIFSDAQIVQKVVLVEDLIPDCLESIKHHVLIPKYSTDVLIKNGLYLLMEVHNRYSDSIRVSTDLCSIISCISQYDNILEEIYQSGWIKILSQWINHPDIRLSAPATQALANLDMDANYEKFAPDIFLLHPKYRSTEKIAVDVIFIHGLLGNVFFTWTTTDRKIGLMEGIGLQAQAESTALTVLMSEPDSEEVQEVLDALKEPNTSDWFSIGHDFEFVYFDSPENSNEAATGPYTFKKNEIQEWDKSTDECWHRDWLPSDCNNIRVLGVSYESSISVWTHDCPELPDHVSLHDRSKEIKESLKLAGVGQRPIIWVTHSMGGLLAKHILVSAAKSEDPTDRKLIDMSKAIFFFSTPHFGSKTANMNQTMSFFLSLTTEVTELRENSPNLIQLHDNFLNLLKENPINIYSFIETKPTAISSTNWLLQFVDLKSGDPGVGEVFVIPTTHSGICKPTNKESFLYQKVLKVVRDTVKEFNPTKFE